MPDRKNFPVSWLAAIAALTAAGVGASRADAASGGGQTTAPTFNEQCAACHSLNPADPPRQGPYWQASTAASPVASRLSLFAGLR